MAGRATRATARTIFVICGLVSLVTCAPYVLLRGTELPVQSEWIVYAVALGAVGVFSVLVGLLPRSWLAKLGKRDRDDARLFSFPLKVLGVCLFRSKPMESRSGIHVSAVSAVFREDDV
jgi:hypothetical protein